MTNIAWALPGGGSKGAWTAGFLSKFARLHPELNHKLIVGTSTGALASPLFGLYAITKDEAYLDDLEHIYRSVKDTDILKPTYKWLYKFFGIYGVLAGNIVFGGESIFSTKPLEQLIDRFVKPEEWEILLNAAKTDDPIEVGFCSTQLQDGHSRVFTTRTHPSRNTLKQALLASARQPVFMELTKISGAQWVDGGLRDYTPVEKLFHTETITECDAIFSVSLTGPEPPVDYRTYGNVVEILLRSLTILTESVYSTDVKGAHLWNIIIKLKSLLSEEQWEEFLLQLPPELRHYALTAEQHTYKPIYDIRPRVKIDISDSLKFQQPEMSNAVDQGIQDAIEFDKKFKMTSILV